MSYWLKGYAIGISFTLVATSFISTSAACVDVRYSLVDGSCFSSATASSDLIEDAPPDTLSYGSKALQSLCMLFKSGSRIARKGFHGMRKHRLKVLTALLALQNREFPIKIPGAAALSVTNINQNLTLYIAGAAIPLLPIMVTTLADGLRVSLRRAHDGCNFTSSVTVLSLTNTFPSSIYQVISGNTSEVNIFLSSLRYTAPNNFRSLLPACPITITETSPPYLATITGIITLNDKRLISVTNINQTLTYVPNGPAVPLLPMMITSPSSSFQVSFLLSYLPSGVLTSSVTFPSLQTTQPTGNAGGWQAFGYKAEVSTLLSNLFFTPAMGYSNTIYLYPGIKEGESPYPNVTGMITINPIGSSSASTTEASQSPSIVSSALSTSFSNVDQNVTNPVDSSNAATIPIPSIAHETTTASIETDTSSTFLLIPSSEPPYGIIGGTVGGIVLCGSIIAGVVAFMRGWFKKSSSARADDHELAIQQPLPGADRLVAYKGLPESPIKSEYEVFQGSQHIAQNETLAHGHYKSFQLDQHAKAVVDPSGLSAASSYAELPTHIRKADDIYASLHSAAASGSLDLIKLHVEDLSTDVNSHDVTGKTALHIAAQFGYIEACRYLLSKGADRTLLTQEGITALALANAQGFTSVVELLSKEVGH